VLVGPKWKSARVRGVAITIVAMAAVLAAANSWQLATQQQTDPFGVGPALERFEAVASRLPASGTIGYISDMPVNDRVGTLAYLQAQYALAPRVLAPVDQMKPSLALGNFARPGDFKGVGARAGYTLETDLGNGVVVYRKASR